MIVPVKRIGIGPMSVGETDGDPRCGGCAVEKVWYNTGKRKRDRDENPKN